MRIILIVSLAIILAYCGIAMADSPGVRVGMTIASGTWSGAATNGIAICNDGSKYFVWMNLLSYPSPRHVYFNCFDPVYGWYSEGMGGQVSVDGGAGYPQLSIINGNKAAIAYHSPSGTPPTYTTLAIDSDPPGMGIFNYYNPPDSASGNRHTIWPAIVVDHHNRIHLAMTENTNAANDPKRLCYERSVDGGVNWWPNNRSPQFVDSVRSPGVVMDISPVSDKILMAYPLQTDTNSAYHNDIVYVLSSDGLTWDFANGVVNVTDYANDNDSLWANTDIDVIFDYNDNFHIIWTANWSTTAYGYYYRTYLFHYLSSNGEIREVCQPWPPREWPRTDCDCINRPISFPSLGVWQDTATSENGIFAVWTKYDTLDCSLGGYSNGDIWYSYSSDLGTNWHEPENLTTTHTPYCACGECDNDNRAILANIVDDSLHIFYLDDKNNGCPTGIVHPLAECPMLYLTKPNPLIGTNINSNDMLPADFQLSQNYPNPFNSNTAILFTLMKESPIKLEIFDITGRKVTTLIDKRVSAGQHRALWDAGKIASGVYYYRLNAGEKSLTKRMVLMK